MSAGQALIQADLDYQKADVDQKVQEYISACQGPSAKLDEAFIMAIEIGSVRLFSFLFKSHKTLISYFRCDKKALLVMMVFGTGVLRLAHDMVILVQR